MTVAFTGGITLKRGDGGGTEIFTVVPELLIAPVLGGTKNTIEVTNYDSTDKEYIAEQFAEGKEVDLSCNLILGDAEQQGVIDDINNGDNRNYEMIITDGTNILTSSFTLTPLEWGRETSLTEQHKLSARFKISGAVVDVLT